MGILGIPLHTHWKQQETSEYFVFRMYKQEQITLQKVKRCSISEFFQNIHYCHLCLLMVAYHPPKFQKNALGWFGEQGVQGFGHNSG